MNEYDRVSLDRFDGKNLQSTVYFLSHLHEGKKLQGVQTIYNSELRNTFAICLTYFNGKIS